MNRNLLIVDDEIEILQWLQELFTYDFGTELSVYTAKSAAEALKHLNRIRMDVVLTDIKMPGMDGITLFEKIKENWPRCKTVFLTGYRNFEDLYRIINHRDVKYLLKTEGDEVILSTVRASFDELEKEQEEARRQTDTSERMEKARYWMRRDLLEQVLSGSIPEDIQSQMAQLGIQLNADQKLQPYLLRLDSTMDSISAGRPALDIETLILSIRENQPAHMNLYLHPLDRQLMLLLLQPAEVAEADWNTFNAVAEGMLEYAQEFFHASAGETFSAILYPEQVFLSEISRYVPLMKMYMNHYVGSMQEMIYRVPSDDLLSGNSFLAPPAGQMNTLLRLMELRREKEYFDFLHACMAEMLQYPDLRNPRALEIYYSVAVRLLQFINQNQLTEALSSRTALYKLTAADEHASCLEAAQYLSDLSREIFQLLEGNETALSGRLLSRVTEYIDSHLGDDLSLTTLAQIGGFNASYLSRLFKQVTGQSPSEYILQKRMHLAKSLLAETNIKIQDIAAQTGYLSAHSFTRTFRNETGISPTDWRMSNQRDTF